jgi:hypothetical protein
MNEKISSYMNTDFILNRFLFITISFTCFFICIGTPHIIIDEWSSVGGIVSADDTVNLDIIGIRMDIPSYVDAGTYLRIVDTVRNRGTQSTGSFSIGYVLQDETGSNPDSYLGNISIQNLVPGGQKSVNVSFPISMDIKSGTYNLRRVILLSDQIVSSKPGTFIPGNEKALYVNNGPEFFGLGYNEENFLTVENEEMLQLLSTIENLNETHSVETKLSYYLSKTGFITDDVIFFGESDFIQVKPSEKQIVETIVPVPSKIENTDYFIITSFIPLDLVSDNSDVFWVSDESYFIGEREPVPTPAISIAPVEPTTSEPDIMTVKTDYPDVMYIGEGAKITDSVTNIGGSTAGIVRVEYLVATQDDGSDARHLGWWTIHNLKAGETRTSQETVGIPDSVRSGIYYLTKKITVTSNPPERNTANNYWTGNRPVRVEYNPAARIPDLTHVLTKFPCGEPGKDAEIIDTITNIGNACAEHVTVAYYISPYADFDPSNARSLGIWEINKICVGEQLTNTITVTVPGDLMNGEYYWFSVIDPCSFMSYCGEELPELDKSNNVNIGQLVIGPCVFCEC